jgi:hypothetical protein
MDVTATRIQDIALTVGASLGAMLGQALTAEDTKEGFKKMLIGTLDIIQQFINTMAAASLLKDVAFLGLTSWATVGAVFAANLALSALKATLGAEEGMMQDVKAPGKKGKSDTMLLWVNPKETILTEDMTKQNKGFLKHLFEGGNEETYFEKMNMKSNGSISIMNNIGIETTLNKTNKTLDRMNTLLEKGINVRTMNKFDLSVPKGYKVSQTYYR